MRRQIISKKRQELIDNINSAELKKGDKVWIKLSVRGTHPDLCVILDLEDDGRVMLIERVDRSTQKDSLKLPITDIVGRYITEVGAFPFDEVHNQVRPVAYTLDSILFGLDIFKEKSSHKLIPYEVQGIKVIETNWNPYVYDKDGSKRYYQRGLVWTLEDKQLLVESVYNGIDCGKILIRERSFSQLEALASRGETELAFKDIVDGKQRLNAIKCFIEEEFPDLHGNYFGDLSYRAQNEFTNHQLFSYAEMSDNTTDEEVIFQFLKMNFSGVPQSKEHIDFVRSIQQKM